MEHNTLTLEITSKGKKHLQNVEPTFFSEIPYQNVTEINYLKDLQEKKQSLDFPIFEFQKDFGEEAPSNDFDRLANTLYKKIMQQGYIQQKKAPSKKKKKTKNPLEYDYDDEWINDEEAITVKKNIYAKVQNFKCFSQSIEDFYSSDLYKSSLSQIQQQSKKKPNEIAMDPLQLEQIKRTIKQNISNAHNKVKEELDGEKPTMISDHQANDAYLEGNSNTDEVIVIKSESLKGQDGQSVSGQHSEIKDNDSVAKASSKSSKSENPEEKSKKNPKVPAKTKSVKKPNKTQKKPKEKAQCIGLREQMVEEEKKGQTVKEAQLQQLHSQKEQNIEATTKNLQQLSIREALIPASNNQMIEECQE